MALLDATARSRVCAQVMRQDEFGAAGITKVDLRAAIDAVDDWVEAAQGALAPPVGFNGALPQPARSSLTAQQKTLLLCWVTMRRAGLLRTVEDGF